MDFLLARFGQKLYLKFPGHRSGRRSFSFWFCEGQFLFPLHNNKIKINSNVHSLLLWQRWQTLSRQNCLQRRRQPTLDKGLGLADGKREILKNLQREILTQVYSSKKVIAFCSIYPREEREFVHWFVCGDEGEKRNYMALVIGIIQWAWKNGSPVFSFVNFFRVNQ